MFGSVLGNNIRTEISPNLGNDGGKLKYNNDKQIN